MTCQLRRLVVASLGVLLFGLVATACSEGTSRPDASRSVGTSGPGETPFVNLNVTPGLAITVKNLAAQPFLNVNVAIKPMTGETLYSTTLPRLEPGEMRSLAFGQFRQSNGTPFSAVLGFVRPKEVSVTATDGAGEKHELTVPWET